MGYTKEQREAKANGATISPTVPTVNHTPEPPAIIRPGKVETISTKIKAGWCQFTAKTRCYIEGAQLEGGQEIMLSPWASYKERHNDHLVLVTGEIPEKLTDAEVGELETGDPKVGAAAKEFRLVKPA